MKLRISIATALGFISALAQAGQVPPPVGETTPETVNGPNAYLVRAAAHGETAPSGGLYARLRKMRGARVDEKAGTVISPPVDFGRGIVATVEVDAQGRIINVTRLKARRGGRPAAEGWSEGPPSSLIIARAIGLE